MESYWKVRRSKLSLLLLILADSFTLQAKPESQCRPHPLTLTHTSPAYTYVRTHARTHSLTRLTHTHTHKHTHTHTEQANPPSNKPSLSELNGTNTETAQAKTKNYSVYIAFIFVLLIKKGSHSIVNKLGFYAQSTGAVISGRLIILIYIQNCTSLVEHYVFLSGKVTQPCPTDYYLERSSRGSSFCMLKESAPDVGVVK